MFAAPLALCEKIEGSLFHRANFETSSLAIENVPSKGLHYGYDVAPRGTVHSNTTASQQTQDCD